MKKARDVPKEALPGLVTVDQLAAWLGISTRGARKLLDRGEFPSCLIGRRRYVLAENVRKAIAAKVATESEVRAEASAETARRARRARAGLRARPPESGGE